MYYLGKIFNRKYSLIYLFFALYILVNLMYLTRFPFVHSDESWLSGLARNMAEKGSFSVTEAFFDLYVRNPHAIKIVFHSMQIVFMKIFGYQLFSFRLLSFIFGMLVLLYQNKLSKVIFGSKAIALLTVVLLSLDVQFIYASHFARQEIVMLFVLVFGLNFYFKHIEYHEVKHDLMLGALIGLSIGLHPNSFIISLVFGSIYLYYIFITKRLKFSSLIRFILTVAIFAAAFVLLSLYFDPNFFSNYAKYGEQFNVAEPITSKFMEVKYFYLKLFYGVSGTYYTPDIRLQFFLFPLVFTASLFKLAKRKGTKESEMIAAVIIAIIVINLGIIIIGRYNQTSIVFIFPLFYILAGYTLVGLKGYFKWVTAALIAVVMCINTVYNVLPYAGHSYDNYLHEIAKAVNTDETVLANLNSEYYFKNGKLFDYRNLALLRDNNMTFKEYIRRNKIQYIIYPEEMDLIYRLQPKWNGLYGELQYYDEMQAFFTDNCSLVHEFTDRVYGIRIVRYINLNDWNIKIFKVLQYE
jgi:4-amino-4-deoxy-L-arabinose transferase-like glycosyltransferase